MKAFLHISSNINKNMIQDFLMTQLDLYEFGSFDIEEVELENDNITIPANNIITIGDIEIETKNKILYQAEELIEENADSYLVFKDIFEMGNEIEKFINIENDIPVISKETNISKYDFYKQSIKNMLKRKNNFNKFIIRVINLLKKYGIIVTYNPNTSLENICNILELLISSYFIYESYQLFYYLQNYMEIDLKLFNCYTKKLTRLETFKYIDNSINFLENCTPKSFYYKSTYNNENERWDTILVFENALQLSIYQLRVYLSKDGNDENIGICKYCKSPFERIGDKKLTCDNYECIRTRQNNRKKKSNQKKKSLYT